MGNRTNYFWLREVDERLTKEGLSDGEFFLTPHRIYARAGTNVEDIRLVRFGDLPFRGLSSAGAFALGTEYFKMECESREIYADELNRGATAVSDQVVELGLLRVVSTNPLIREGMPLTKNWITINYPKDRTTYVEFGDDFAVINTDANASLEVGEGLRLHFGLDRRHGARFTREPEKFADGIVQFVKTVPRRG